MRIEFNKVKIHNFMSFADEEIQLSDMGYTIVTGRNNRIVDNAESNGSGKSTIFNAVCYALTGETAQGLSNNVENMYSNPDDCWVELDFSVDDDRFVIRRIKTPKTDLKIYINGVDASGKGIKESTKLLNDYLPDLNSRLLGSIIILGQGLPYRFTDNHPGGRKEILEKLTKSDYMIQSIRERLDRRFDELKVQLRSYEDANVSNDTKIGMLNHQLASYEGELKKLYDIPDEKFNDIEEQIEDAKDRIKRSSGAGARHREELSNINSKITEVTDICYKSASNVNEAFGNFDITSAATIATLNTTIKTLKKQIKDAENMPDVCPTCGQKIPEDRKIDTKPLKEELEKANNDLKNQENIKKESDEQKKIQLDAVRTKFSTDIKELTLKKNDLEELISSDEISFKDWTIKLNELSKMELEIKNINENREKIRANLEAGRQELKNVVDEKAKIESNIAITNEHISIIQTMITLTKREFRGVLLENVIKYINKKCKEYSMLVFNTDLLSFELNENYIDIKYDGKYYEALSGGEKQKLDIIIQLAIRDLLSNHLNIHSNILVCDEILDNLDAQGCQRIIDLISKLKDVESVFVISHHASELQISYDNQIEVEKGDNGISVVKVH